MLLDKRQALGSTVRDMRARASQLSSAGANVRVRAGKAWQGPDGTFGRGMMHAKALRVNRASAHGSTNHTRNSTSECCEIATEVTVSASGVEEFRARFSREFGAAYPLSEVPTAPSRPRRRVGSTSS